MPTSSSRSMVGMLKGLCILVFTALVAAAPAQAAGGKTGTGTPTESTKLYDYYLTGNAANVKFDLLPNEQMLVLMGGGLDVDAAYVRMVRQARSKQARPVDVVVIRTSGADGYNDYIMDLAPGEVDSVESVVIKSRDGAESDRVNEIVAAADVLYIAGGDQWTYIAMWAGTRLETTIKTLLSNKVPFGGTSAGLAVLGEVDFSAQYDTVTSSNALDNPYDRRVTLSTKLIGPDAAKHNVLPALENVITDSHIVTRDRMGRLVTFLARMMTDLLTPEDDTRGIGVDEATAVVVLGDRATVVGSGLAYFLRPSRGLKGAMVQAKQPLTIDSVHVQKMSSASPAFQLSTWSSNSADQGYFLTATGGTLYSTQAGGTIY